MKSQRIQTMVLTNLGTEKKPKWDKKNMEFDLKDVTGFAESQLPGHTDIAIPGGIFTIGIQYLVFQELINKFKDETEENKNSEL